VAAW
jgi:hypothetical protein